MQKKKYCFGQSVLEYALIISVVVAAISAMTIYVQRSVQSNLKIIEDQVNRDTNTANSTRVAQN